MIDSLVISCFKCQEENQNAKEKSVVKKNFISTTFNDSFAHPFLLHIAFIRFPFHFISSITFMLFVCYFHLPFEFLSSFYFLYFCFCSQNVQPSFLFDFNGISCSAHLIILWLNCLHQFIFVLFFSFISLKKMRFCFHLLLSFRFTWNRVKIISKEDMWDIKLSGLIHCEKL